jgi:hypothetical protein
MEFPRLIEPNARFFLQDTLKKCHDNRFTIYYYIFNISIFVIFVGAIACILYYCHTHKLSDYEKQRKMIVDQQYVLSKIRFYQEEIKERPTTSITSLPFMTS